MSWRDREYNRSDYKGGSTGQTVFNLFFGSVSLGSLFGIRIRIHATFFWFVAITLLAGTGRDGLFLLHYRAISMGALFLMVLMHEFGHCFASRAVGGHPQEILMHPLGGLAFADAPHRWGANLVTVVGGPLVNVLICVVAAVVIYLVGGFWPDLNPLHPIPPRTLWATTVTVYAWWVFYTSYYLFLFNLLPVYPFDGAQMLQSVMWWRIGYYRATMTAYNIGLGAAVLLALFGLVTGMVGMILIAIFSGIYTYQQRMLLRDTGPHGLTDDVDYSSSLRMDDQPRRRKLSRRSIKRAQKRAAAEQAEQARIDEILDKVSAHGMQSLTWWEKRTLRKATERQRQRDLELSKMRD